MKYNSEVWGPHYWFFLHTIADSYPNVPNDVTKRKYYDFIQNIPMFIPNSDIANNFSQINHLIDKVKIKTKYFSLILNLTPKGAFIVKVILFNNQGRINIIGINHTRA